MDQVYKRLTADQKQAIFELTDSPNWKTMVQLVQMIANEIQLEVITRVRVEDGADNVMFAKAKGEGAVALAKVVLDLKEFINKQDNE